MQFETVKFLNSTGPKEGPTELVCPTAGCYLGAIFEDKLSLAFVLDRQGIHTRTHLDVIVTTKLVAVVRPHDQKVANWRVVGNLFCV